MKKLSKIYWRDFQPQSMVSVLISILSVPLDLLKIPGKVVIRGNKTTQGDIIS